MAGRLGLLVLVAAAPVLVVALLGTSPVVAPLFGGLPGFGAVSALASRLYLLHIVVLVGFRATLVLGGERTPLHDRAG